MAWTLALAFFLVGWWGVTTDNSRAANKPGLSMLLPHFDSDKLFFLVRLTDGGDWRAHSAEWQRCDSILEWYSQLSQSTCLSD